MSSSTASPDDLLTSREVAAILRIPARAPYELGRVGAFPVVYVGSRWRVFRRDLMTFISGRRYEEGRPCAAPYTVDPACPASRCPWVKH